MGKMKQEVKEGIGGSNDVHKKVKLLLVGLVRAAVS